MNRIIWLLPPFLHEVIYRLTGWRLAIQIVGDEIVGHKWVKQETPTKWH